MMTANLLTKVFRAARLRLLMKMCSWYRIGKNLNKLFRVTYNYLRKGC